MRDIDNGKWEPVPDSISFSVLGVILAIDAIIAFLVVSFCHSKGWL